MERQKIIFNLLVSTFRLLTEIKNLPMEIFISAYVHILAEMTVNSENNEKNGFKKKSIETLFLAKYNFYYNALKKRYEKETIKKLEHKLSEMKKEKTIKIEFDKKNKDEKK